MKWSRQQNVNMIFDTSDRDQFLRFVLKYAGNVFEQFFFPSVPDKTSPVLHCENRLYVDLGVGVCHECVNSIFGKSVYFN